MLARAARRRLRRDVFRTPSQLAEQLTLPWLCPAQMRWAASARPPSAINSRETRKPTPSSPLSLRRETRSLATAADLQPGANPAASFGMVMQAWSTPIPSPDIAKLPPWDPERPLIINPATAAGFPVTPMRHGIGGDPVELHQNLYACLRVGRLERATKILHRLADMYQPSAPELVDAHNVYLRALLEHVEPGLSDSPHAALESWFNTQMVRKGVQPNAQTLVLLVRAAMRLPETERGAEIQQYMAIAEELGPATVDEVNSSPDFTDEEWDTLIRFQPDAFDEPPPLEVVQELQLSTPAGQLLAIQHGLVPTPTAVVTPVSQKGLGLRALKQSLSMFEPGKGVAYPHELDISAEEKDKTYAYMRQIRLEEDAVKSAVERWKAEDQKLSEMGIHGVLQSKSLQALMYKWYIALLPLIKDELHAIRTAVNASGTRGSDERLFYGPYLESCRAEELAGITVHNTIIGSITRQKGREDIHHLKISTLTTMIGRAVEELVLSKQTVRQQSFMQGRRSSTRKAMLARLRKSKGKSNPDLQAHTSKTSSSPDDTRRQHNFPNHVISRIGAIFVDMILKSAKVTITATDPRTGEQVSTTQPAFSHTTSFAQGRNYGWINHHWKIAEKLATAPVHNMDFNRPPMLIPPKPWTSFNDGGYYTKPGEVVRIRGNDIAQRAYCDAAIENGDMQKLLSALDHLGKIPWNINKDVFKVMVEAWNTGEGIAGLVPEEIALECPEDLPHDASLTDRVKWTKLMKAYENRLSGFHSQKCFQNFQLEIARAYLNETFYFPHSVDFRGRAYPVPPILNHMGADPARGLLKFANGKELGAVGLQWLKIHLANLYGFDKASLKDREKFTMDHLEQIFDSAQNPLGGTRWWTNAEDPWQSLGCCFELRNALTSPDPERYVSHVPIHQDGTCNGLQHYAALGGDMAGANQVNLEPSDRPQDIYTGVAELVKEMVVADAENGNRSAKFMRDKITRKVVKRTVMTNVYGVTFHGAQQQVLSELQDMFPGHRDTKDVPSLNGVAVYIATNIFKALGKIFNGAQEIQYWLGECADRITLSLSAEQVQQIYNHSHGEVPSYMAKYKTPTKSKRAQQNLIKNLDNFRTGVIWTTPLKMPVVQPYRKDGFQKVQTPIQTIHVGNRSSSDIVDRNKQLRGFPPNFIHSLDATHMMLSALKASEMGMDFAAVHDSFWTHAADIPNLNIILRDAFVRMHSEDIISRLAAEFKTRYEGAMYKATLMAKSPVANKIQTWRREYNRTNPDEKKPKRTFWGTASTKEIAMEVERLKLLASDVKADRKKGEAMVTPTKIWLENKDPLALESQRQALLGETNRGQGSNGKGTKFDMVRQDVLGAETGSENPSSHTALHEDLSTESPEDAEAANAMESEDMEAVDAEAEADFTAPKYDLEGVHTNKRRKQVTREPVKVEVWLPLSFPPVPKKGEWDVKRLRESKYFFS
ncbi:mitochondrial DNA-directed RNA polymeras-like protein [Amniculicola lignicola CBS 123094]|uniref:DNA-directed RNA polymerase n=1 Tax=Amniculicola lignicola CBS 123094 TaxID=1392246 RepID=A0A6A5VST4_9PLEO|nr:mitochondrial DNA-directed RNA polymeras-like protein [Amniculicola lignicola CBS 123094]